MILYAVILLCAAALFLAVGIAIRRGNTGLIHDYHQTRVSDADRPAYARSFSAGIFILAGAMAASALAALANRPWSSPASLILLFGGIAAAVVQLLRVQKRYNGGLF